MTSDGKSVPLRPVMEPLVWRLSPRQPGYVMTVWEETRVERRERSVAAAGSNSGEASIVYRRVEYLYKPNDQSRQADLRPRVERESSDAIQSRSGKKDLKLTG